MTDQPMTGAQMAQMQQKLGEAFQTAINNMQLRKWCVEKAVEIIVSGGFNPNEKAPDFAASLYDFITKPALEALQQNADASEGRTGVG